MADVIVSVLAEAVLTYLTDKVNLWKKEPQQAAFKRALDSALSEVTTHHPGFDSNLFGHFLLEKDITEMLSRFLQPKATEPTGDELALSWMRYLKISESDMALRSGYFTAITTDFLARLKHHLLLQEELRDLMKRDSK